MIVCVHVYTDVHAVYYMCVSVNCSLGVILFFLETVVSHAVLTGQKFLCGPGRP